MIPRSRSTSNRNGSLEMRYLPPIQSARWTIGNSLSKRRQTSTNRRDRFASATRRITRQPPIAAVLQSPQGIVWHKRARISPGNRASQNDPPCGKSTLPPDAHPRPPTLPHVVREHTLPVHLLHRESQCRGIPLRGPFLSDTGCSTWRHRDDGASPGMKAAPHDLFQFDTIVLLLAQEQDRLRCKRCQGERD